MLILLNWMQLGFLLRKLCPLLPSKRKSLVNQIYILNNKCLHSLILSLLHNRNIHTDDA